MRRAPVFSDISDEWDVFQRKLLFINQVLLTYLSVILQGGGMLFRPKFMYSLVL